MYNGWRSSITLCIVVLFHLDNGLGANDGICQLIYENGTQLPEDVWNFGLRLKNKLQDTAPTGTVVLTFKTDSIKEIESSMSDTVSDLKYISTNLDIEENKFQVTLTDNFQYYEKYETKDMLKMNVTFKCKAGARKLDIYQQIEDTNNHNPEFVDAPYEYTLPIPFPPNIQIGHFSKKIAARDIDLSNNFITFSLNSLDPNSHGLSVDTVSVDEDMKKHYAMLKTTAFLDLRNDVTFELYAKVLIIHFDNGPVSLSQGVDKTVKYEFEVYPAEYQDVFRIVSFNDSSTIELHLIALPEALKKEAFIIITLNAAKLDATETAILHLSLSEKTIITEYVLIEGFFTTTIVLGVLEICLLAGAIIALLCKTRNSRKSAVVDNGTTSLQ